MVSKDRFVLVGILFIVLVATLVGAISAKIAGSLYAEEICDENGENCKDVSSDWGSGGGLPSGAIIAFNSASCPSGWTELTDARGKVIVGQGNGLGFGDTGGSRTQTLTANQLPPHSHTIDVYRGGGGSIDGVSWTDNGAYHWTRGTQSTGSGQAFNIMQPYVVYTYCVKN